MATRVIVLFKRNKTVKDQLCGIYFCEDVTQPRHPNRLVSRHFRLDPMLSSKWTEMALITSEVKADLSH